MGNLYCVQNYCIPVYYSQSVATCVQSRDDDLIELVPGTSLFISAGRLQQILSTVKTGKQLARKLMSVFWDRHTLARSTLSASSQHYEQLDPSIVSAIKSRFYVLKVNLFCCFVIFTAYCVLFDKTVRKSEIHSTMIDKCVQSRRPRRSSLKRLDYQQELKLSPTRQPLETDDATANIVNVATPTSVVVEPVND